MKRGRVSWKFVAATTALCGLPLSVALWRMTHQHTPPDETYVFPSKALAELDRVVQARFAVVPTNDFGVGRIGPLHEYFQPVTAGERTVIGALQSEGKQVVFYVVGRRTILGQEDARSRVPPVQGPIYMTGNAPLRVIGEQKEELYRNGPKYRPIFRSVGPLPPNLPSNAQLIAPLEPMLQSRSRWNSADTSVGKQFKAGSWRVVAVPVRATDEACARCHRSWGGKYQRVNAGDPLGIALYAYRPAPAKQMQRVQRAMNTLKAAP